MASPQSSETPITPALNILKLLDITRDIEGLPQHLQRWGLIPTEGAYKCPACGNPLKLQRSSNRADGWVWQCNHKVSIRKQKGKKCGTRIEFRSGTFFARSKLSLLQILGFINYWVQYASLALISNQLEISEHTACNWSSFCRQACLDYFLRRPVKLGGQGIIVEIDEAKFRQGEGDRIEGKRVFSGYEKGTGRILIVAVGEGDPDALLPVIEEWIESGTTIVSNYWKTNNVLHLDGYEQLKIDCSITFKEPEIGANTNIVGCSRRAGKASVTDSPVAIKEYLPGDLARYLFFRRCRDLQLDKTIEFFRLVGELYNPAAPRGDLDEHGSDDGGEAREF